MYKNRREKIFTIQPRSGQVFYLYFLSKRNNCRKFREIARFVEIKKKKKIPRLRGWLFMATGKLI